MDAKPKSKIELTTSPDDWKIIRECYVKSFLRYPLYKYMVPDDQEKRAEFLRAYLDANYEVTVGSGHGILLAIKVLVGSDDEAHYKVVGGVVFVPPSSDGCGWAIGTDEPYWNAYEKYRLAEISSEGLERVKRYEAWENDHIAQKLSGARIPLWNGLFCAIEPDYASKGVGSAVYKEAIRIMAKFWVKQQTCTQESKQTETESHEKDENKGFFGKVFRKPSFRSLHHFTLLHHRTIPSAAFAQKNLEAHKQNSEKNPCSSQENNLNKPSKNAPSYKDMMFNPDAPLVVAISHSERSSKFHQSNGFQPVSRLPFYDEVDGKTPFYTHVLILDPFCTGKFSQMEAALLSKENRIESDYSPALVKNLKPSNHILL